MALFGPKVGFASEDRRKPAKRGKVQEVTKLEASPTGKKRTLRPAHSTMDQPTIPTTTSHPPWSASPQLLSQIFGPNYNRSYMPLLCIITSFTFASYVLGNTPSQSRWRYPAVLVLGLNLYIIVLKPPTFTYHVSWNSLISSQLAVHFFGGVDKLVIARWTYEGCRPNDEANGDYSAAISHWSQQHSATTTSCKGPNLAKSSTPRPSDVL